MIIPGNLWKLENETTFAEDEQEDLDRENRIWGNGATMLSSPRQGADNDLQNTVMGIQQVQMENQNNQFKDLMARLHAKELENMELRALKRKAEEEEEPIAPLKKIRITGGEDDAWHTINKSARMVRPYCGDWEKKYKDLGRKADPVKERLDWVPMGSLTLAQVTIKKLHDRGSNITIRMFWPKNRDVMTKQTRILVHKDNTFLEPTLDFKDPRETWQLMEALNTYTLALSRVWPEDWTGLALQRILINYRWLSNCGKLKSVQVSLLTSFINQVFSLNASNRRDGKTPLKYKEIEDTMSEIIWIKGIEKSANCGGRDSYASTSLSVPQHPNTSGPPAQRTRTSSAGPSCQPGKRGGKSGGSGRPRPSAGGQSLSKLDPRRLFNTSAGCQHQPCKFQHACNRYKSDGKMCWQTGHNADNHT